MRQVREDVVTTGEMVERIEAVRVQMQTIARFSEDEEVVGAIESLDGQFTDLLMEIVDLRLTGQGQDGVRFGAELLQKLTYLPRGLSVADFPPTNQEAEVKEILHAEMIERGEQLDALLATELRALNEMLAQKGLALIMEDGDRAP